MFFNVIECLCESIYTRTKYKVAGLTEQTDWQALRCVGCNMKQNVIVCDLKNCIEYLFNNMWFEIVIVYGE